jgi:beta-lactamase superfamily II metal-dependent hydrolase
LIKEWNEGWLTSGAYLYCIMKRLLPLLAILLAGCAHFRPAARPATDWRNSLTVVVADVGQGESIVIRGPTGRIAVIDAGVSRATGARVWNFIRDSLETRRLDWVFASHYHIDHIGGLVSVLDSVFSLSPDSLVFGVFDRGGETADTFFVNYATAARDRRRSVVLGEIYDLGGGAALTCVLHDGKVLSGDSVVPAEENSRSIGLLLEYDGFRMIIASDIGGYRGRYSDIETILAPVVGRVSVLYVNHHGSAHSSNPFWLETLRPQASVISCGTGNPWGHPTEKALSRLLASPGNKVYQTQRGALDPQDLRIAKGRIKVVASNVWIVIDPPRFQVNADWYRIE